MAATITMQAQFYVYPISSACLWGVAPCRRKFYQATVDLLQKGRGDQFQLDGEQWEGQDYVHESPACAICGFYG